MSIGILLVDDEEGIRNSLAAYLELEGYSVDLADSCAKAIEMLSVKRYGIVFIDINMPDIDGISALKKIKEADFSTQVIMLTPHSSFEKTVKSLEVGATDYILKPFEKFEDILKLVQVAQERLMRWRRNMAESIVSGRRVGAID